MLHRFFIRVLFWLLAFLTSTLASAQISTVGVPPPRTSIDGNGVDLFLGTINYQQTDISIGQGAGLLAFTRSWENGGWRNSLVGSIQASSTSVGGTYTISLGGSSDSFTKTSSGFTSQQGNGSTLTLASGVYTYATTGGITATFAQATAVTSRFASNEGWITSLSYATGQRIDYAYRDQRYCLKRVGDNCPGGYGRVVRLQSVRNNSGYMLKPAYASNDADEAPQLPSFFAINSVTSINEKIDYCDPVADSCSTSRTWPAVTYAGPTSMTDPVGRTWSYVIDGTNNLTGIRWPTSSSNDITIGYDGNGRVQSYATAAGTWGYVYTDNAGTNTRTTVVTDPYGHTRTAVFDLTSQRMKQDTQQVSSGVNRVFTYDYDSIGRLTKATAPESNFSSFTYDSYGNVTNTVTVPKGSADTVCGAGHPALCTSAAFAYCPGVACASPSSTTDAKGNATTYTYTSAGQPLTIVQPAPASGQPQPEVHYTYASFTPYYKQSATSGPTASTYLLYLPTQIASCRTTGWPCAASDRTVTNLGYDTSTAGNNLTPASSASGSGDGSLTATATFVYDEYGNLASADGPLPGSDDITKAYFDAARNPLGLIGPDPDGAGALKNRAIRYSYNAKGWVTTIERGTVASYATPLSSMTVLAKAVRDYDSLGRVTSASTYDIAANAAITLTQFSYDALSRPDCTAIRMNASTWSALPAACTLATTGSYGPDRISKTSYNWASDPILVQQALGTSDQIDAATMTHTANGKLATLADARSYLTTYSYDGYDRLDKTRYPDPNAINTSSTTDYTQNVTYDANSAVTQYRLRDGNTVSMTYDALGRLLTRGGTTVASRAYTYDNFGQLTGAGFPPAASSVTFGYDALGRVVSEASGAGTFTEGYDLAGRRTSMKWPDAFTLTYTRLVTGEISTVTENSGGGIPVALGYDDLGRMTGFGKYNGHSQSYAYDYADRLTALTTQGLSGGSNTAWLTYNPASQSIQRQTSDEQLSANVAYNVSRDYVANGLNQYTKAGAPGVAHDANGNLSRLAAGTFAYDGDNLLTGGSAGAGLAYDPLDRLRQSPDDGGTIWAYAAGMLVGEYTTSGTLKRRYLPGDAPDQVLIGYEGSGLDRRYSATDERGSITEVSNGSGTLAINTYDDWGIPAAGNVGRFGYTGQTWLPSVQAWNYKARVYQPLLGRFLQTDPIGYNDGMNWYNYVGGDPINRIDPTGLEDVALTWECNYVCQQSWIWQRQEAFERSLDVGRLLNSGLGSTGRDGGGGGGAAKSPTETQQTPKPNPCQSTLYRVGNGMKYAGKGITYSGIAIAAIGSPAGPVGAAPGLTIAEGGGALGAVGQGLQDIAFSRPGLEIATRFAANLFGGKVLSSLGLVSASLRSGLGDTIYEEATNTALSPALPSLDPARCPG